MSADDKEGFHKDLKQFKEMLGNSLKAYYDYIDFQKSKFTQKLNSITGNKERYNYLQREQLNLLKQKAENEINEKLNGSFSFASKAYDELGKWLKGIADEYEKLLLLEEESNKTLKKTTPQQLKLSDIFESGQNMTL